MILDWKQDLTEYIQYTKKMQDDFFKLCGVPKEFMDKNKKDKEEKDGVD